MSLLILVEEAQKNNREAMLMILKQFERKIWYELKQTKPQDRDDLSQHLYMKMIETIKTYDLEQTPGFWEFLHQYKMADMPLTKH